jgi:predicted RecB family nuclease
MLLSSQGIRLSATDLSNHLACRHLTALNLSVARGERKAPAPHAPDLIVIQELGLRHEAAYVKSLEQSGLAVADLREVKNDSEAARQTLAHMANGVDVIAQAALAAGRWFGRPDILRNTNTPCPGLGTWSYEPYDCKLATDTKAATILQLAVYAALLVENQGLAPEHIYVVPARREFQPEKYRLAEYAAYYRYVRRQLEKACEADSTDLTYPEPCEHCEICRWFAECDAARRADDHLAYVAGISRQQRNQFNLWQIETMQALAGLPIPLAHKPKHGSKAAFEKVREQARVQIQGRAENRPVHELFVPCPDLGLCNLPQPSASDIFLDIEGDRFAGPDGLQYLFGFVVAGQGGTPAYECRWSVTP